MYQQVKGCKGSTATPYGFAQSSQAGGIERDSHTRERAWPNKWPSHTHTRPVPTPCPALLHGWSFGRSCSPAAKEYKPGRGPAADVHSALLFAPHGLNNPVKYIDPTGHVAELDDHGVSLDDPCLDGNGNKIICGIYPEGHEKGGQIIPEPKNDNECYTVSCNAYRGDTEAIFDLLTPTDFGWRLQLEGCIKLPLPIGPCGTGGANIVYNRSSNELIGYFDWAGAVGPGEGGGVSLTTGPLLGWFASDTEHLASGSTTSLSGTLAYEGAVSVSASSSLKEDVVYGTLPILWYGGGGIGGAYFGGGMSLISDTPISYTASNVFPWR